MATLDANARNALSSSDFAIPASKSASGKDEYPIDTRDRAISALARVETNGTPAEKAMVRAAVKRKYPNLPSSQGQGDSAAAKHNAGYAGTLAKQIMGS
jgi:hypothetical protein